MAIVNASISGAALLGGFLLKETPYFLVMKGRTEAAKNNLSWLRAGDAPADVKQELDKIGQSIEAETTKRRSIFGGLNKDHLKTMMIIVIVYVLIQCTGGAPINAYVSIILHSSPTLSADQFTIIFGVLQLMGSFVTPFVIERCNRRTLLLGALLIMGLCQGCTCILYALGVDKWCSYFPWMILATISTYAAVNAFIQPVLIMIRSELLPTGVRAIGGSLGLIMDSIAAFATARLYLPVNSLYGVQYNFLFYFISSMVVVVCIFAMLPETRGKSLADIQLSHKSTNE